uniref:Methyltransferase n=1 Tax=viral metagenome TaxID=1070528 RepID=A0A6C0CJM3_9ZZZZ
MVNYDLSHLTQDETQNVWGPIQDDEALFLYSIIRGSRLERILEIGGLDGYSGTNFLKALSYTKNGKLYTCDLNPVPVLAENHKVLIKNAMYLTAEDLDNQPLDLVFFDCHDMVQMSIYNNLVSKKIINNDTILVLHDTNLHYAPYHKWGKYVRQENGIAHQPVERRMVNMFKNLGYDVFSISTDRSKHSPDFPVRHGVTICKRFKTLA